MVNSSGHEVIAVGASAGGVHALSRLVGGLPPDLPAAVFVVLHISPRGYSALPAILSRSGPLPATHPEDGERIRPGHIYVAPPDHHLALRHGRVHLNRNATENGHRPAVDVLFRTAAKAYGPGVIGVVLTGNLDDGTAGLAEIKRCGGRAVVQDPDEADYSGMPTSAIAHVAVDHVVPLAAMGRLLSRLLSEPRQAPDPDCGDNAEEPDDRGVSQNPHGAAPGEPSGLTCPECGGALFETPGNVPLHFRCRTGHAYSPDSLFSKQLDSLDGSLWAALRALEESAALSRRLEARARRLENSGASRRFAERASYAERHAEVLRRLLSEDAQLEKPPGESDA